MTSLVRSHYHPLLRAFGRQGWWPTTPAGDPSPVYFAGRSARSLNENERFEICLGALLTQNTGWTNVETVLRGLTIDGLLSAAGLHRLAPVEMERYLRSSGYFRQKAKRVRFFLDAVRDQAGGSVTRFLSGPARIVRERLLRLHGIGPETADSMLLYAAGKPIFVVDAYTRRIAGRWGLLTGSERYDEVQRRFESALPRSAKLFAEYHALLVRLAKEHCRPQPICAGCPARPRCAYGQRHRAAPRRLNRDRKREKP